MKRNEIKRTCFFTSQTKVIQTLIEIYCNLLVGKTINEIQDVVKNYDKKFEKIDTSRRRHSLMFKDEGGNAVGSENDADDLLGINKFEREIQSSKDNIDV